MPIVGAAGTAEPLPMGTGNIALVVGPEAALHPVQQQMAMRQAVHTDRRLGFDMMDARHVRIT
jgi:hypothetical protein